MGLIARGLFKCRWQPQLQFVRNNTKVNITRPRPPHFERALLENVCLPKIKKNVIPSHVPDFEGCAAQFKKPKVEVDHPLLGIIIKEVRDLYKNSRMIAFFHLNDLDEEEKFQCELAMKKNGAKLVRSGKFIMKESLKGTIYEPITGLFSAPTMTAYSPEADIHKLLNIVKKLPKLVLMAAIVDGRLLSLTELKTYGKFKDITEARVMLLSTLNSASQRLVQQINHHPNNFVGLLQERKKMLEGS